MKTNRLTKGRIQRLDAILLIFFYKTKKRFDYKTIKNCYQSFFKNTLYSCSNKNAKSLVLRSKMFKIFERKQTLSLIKKDLMKKK